MAKVYLATTNAQCGSTAAIRSWAGQIRATFIAGGWIQTGDAGQTNANVLPAAGTPNQILGYEIWRMADALQATSPCFLKVEYASGSGGASGTQIFLTIGTGSDGSGNITGVIFARAILFNIASSAATSAPSYGSATTSRISFAVGAGVAFFAFSIERSHDTSGNDTADGFMLLGAANTSAVLAVQNFTYVYSDGLATTNNTKIGSFVPSGATWADSGGVIGVCSVRFFDGQPSNPCLSWLAYMNGDTAVGFQISVNLYGVARTFMPLGTMMTTVASGNANSSLAMIWE